MNPENDPHLDVCQNIEASLKAEYESHPELTDGLCVFGLENSIVALKKQFGYARNQRISPHPLIAGIVERCVALGMARIGVVDDLTMKEYVLRIEKVKRSVIRHSEYGTRGYYEFIKNFV